MAGVGSILNLAPQANAPIDTVQVAVLRITSAQFLNSSFQLIKGIPGAILEIVSVAMNMQFPAVGGVAYAGGSAMNITTSSTVGVSSVSFGAATIAGAAGSVYVYGHAIPVLNANGSLVSNQLGNAIFFNFAGALFTAGNSDFIITVRYRIVQVS